MPPETPLLRSLLAAFRPDFGPREASARHLAELVLDAVDAILPLEQHAPAELALGRLEELMTASDVFSYEGAPGWDVVLAEGLAPRTRKPPFAPPILDGLGGSPRREEQRGELKRRTRAQAKRLIELGRLAAAGADADTVVALHATLLRLFSLAAVSSSLLLAEDPLAGSLPSPTDLEREIAGRQGGFPFAQEEWLARLLANNPAAAQAPVFRRLFAGLSQALRTGDALSRLGRGDVDLEALLGATGGFQPIRWQELRGGAPAAWFVELCPGGDGSLESERRNALDVLSRLWAAENASLTAFTTLYGLFVARCSSATALAEERL